MKPKSKEIKINDASMDEKAKELKKYADKIIID